MGGNGPGVSRPKRTKDDRANSRVVLGRIRLRRTRLSYVWSLWMFRLGPKKGPLEDAWIKVQRLERCLSRLAGRLGGPETVPRRAVVSLIGPSLLRLRSQIEEERRQRTRVGISSLKSADDILGTFYALEREIEALPGSVSPPLPARVMKEVLSASRKLGVTLKRTQAVATRQRATELFREQHPPAFRAVKRALSTLNKEAARSLTSREVGWWKDWPGFDPEKPKQVLKIAKMILESQVKDQGWELRYRSTVPGRPLENTLTYAMFPSVEEVERARHSLGDPKRLYVATTKPRWRLAWTFEFEEGT